MFTHNFKDKKGRTDTDEESPTPPVHRPKCPKVGH